VDHCYHRIYLYTPPCSCCIFSDFPEALVPADLYLNHCLTITVVSSAGIYSQCGVSTNVQVSPRCRCREYRNSTLRSDLCPLRCKCLILHPDVRILNLAFAVLPRVQLSTKRRRRSPCSTLGASEIQRKVFVMALHSNILASIPCGNVRDQCVVYIDSKRDE